MKKDLLKFIGAIWVILPVSAIALNAQLMTAFTNPAPSFFGEFGYSVAALGSDRAFISAPAGDLGAENAGQVYLYSTNGTLLSTITNPVPKTGASFGEAIAVAGGDLILIGARFADNGGAAYLFDTNAVLVKTFTNPTPRSVLEFGSSVASVGGDRILVGAKGYEADITNSGAAFLFGTNGTLLTTMTNPIPGGRAFGYAVASVFGDELAVGAPISDPTVTSGTTYVFDTNGVLLSTLTAPNPTSFDNFGASLQAVGEDRMLVGTVSSEVAGTPGGAAFLFDRNGTLLSSFAALIPLANAQFGTCISLVGDDRLLIGSPLGPDETRAGAADLFNTNGNLLASFFNPSASSYANQYLQFGASVAALGSKVVLIGSPLDNTGAMNAGAAYAFKIPPPQLRIQGVAANAVQVSWFSPASDFVLQDNTNALAAADWRNVTNGFVDDGTNVTIVVDPATGGSRFYRLTDP